MNADCLQVWADTQEDLGLDTALARGFAAWLSQPSRTGGLSYPTNCDAGSGLSTRNGHSYGIQRGGTYSYDQQAMILKDSAGNSRGGGLGCGEGGMAGTASGVGDPPGDGVGDGDSYPYGGGKGDGFGYGFEAGGPRTTDDPSGAGWVDGDGGGGLGVGHPR